MTEDLEYRRHLSKSVYTSMGGLGKLRAQTRAEAEDAEMKILMSKDGRRALLIKLRNP